MIFEASSVKIASSNACPRCKSREHRRRGFILESISWHRLTEDESWLYCSAGRGDTTQIISCRIPICLPSRLRANRACVRACVARVWFRNNISRSSGRVAQLVE